MLKLPQAFTLLTVFIITGCNFQTVKQETATTSPPPTVEEHDRNRLITQQDGNAQQSKDSDETPSSDLATSHDDLWSLISDDLQFDTHTDHVWVKSKLNCFAKNQEYINRVAERARPYLHHIVSRLRARNMPMDLALLPIVESAYQPFAYSPSRASGIWQFISSTGKRFGLKQNWWYDGRRDIVAATEAALDYLETLHRHFNGNWFHALAAYNAGEGNVGRAIRRNKRAGKPTDFWHLRLPRETRGYVPSLLAVAELLKKSDEYKIVFNKIENKPYFESIDVGSQIDLALVSELSGLTMDEVYTLNPGFNRWATDPDGPHNILVPLEKALQFKQKITALPPDQRISWVRHTIKQGESLGLIARKHNTSIATLKSANKLRSNLIRAGDSLLIPTSRLSEKDYTLSADSRKFRGLKKTGDGKKYIYQVTHGDNLWDIGRNYGVSVHQLTQWNGISSKSILRLGQKLVVWVQDNETEEEKEEDDDYGMPKLANNTDNANSYTVKQGDSLWLIARKFDIHVKDIVKWNNLNKKKPLQPGQTLVIRTALTGV